jgi:putative transposase
LGVSTNKLSTPEGAGNSESAKTGGKNEKWKPVTICVIINQYKRIVTIQVRKTNADFNWQSQFYDHVIQDSQSFKAISNYIRNNPKNREFDEFR